MFSLVGLVLQTRELADLALAAVGATGLASINCLPSQALHDKKTRELAGAAHPYMALLTPDRGALVHGDERVGVLGRDSLGDKYLLESTTSDREHAGMESRVFGLQSTVFGVRHPGALSHKCFKSSSFMAHVGGTSAR